MATENDAIEPEKPGVDRRDFVKTAVTANLALAVGSASAGPPSPVKASQSLHPAVAAIRKLLENRAAITWVFTGDSITHGALHTFGWRSYVEHFAERIRWELANPRQIVINTGISGERVGGIVDDFRWRIARFQPQVVSVMIGMNDAHDGMEGREKFRTGLATLVDRLQKIKAIILLNTPNTIYLKNAAEREDLPAYAQIVRDVAGHSGAAVVDHWNHWQRVKPKQDDLIAWLADAAIHPNVYGHREIAKLIFRELTIFDPASLTCKLDVP